jgi:hypothetical protein
VIIIAFGVFVYRTSPAILSVMVAYVSFGASNGSGAGSVVV